MISKSEVWACIAYVEREAMKAPLLERLEVLDLLEDAKVELAKRVNRNGMR